MRFIALLNAAAILGDDFIAAFGRWSPTAVAPDLIRLAGHNILELFRISS
jgi:hypothetical protein